MGKLLLNMVVLATAPGGVARLRELILTLAVQGKLVPQDSGDEPASELLKKIRAEKERLIAAGKIKRDKPLGEITVEEKPFGLPVGWEWQTLAEIGRWAIGSGFPHEAQGREGLPILFAKVSDMNLLGNELEIVKTNHTIDDETVARLRINVHEPGAVIFPKIGGAIATNKRRILVRPTAIDNNCLGITPSAAMSTSYLFLLLSSLDFTVYQAGTSVPALSQGTLGQIAVGLPPIAEQSRIVTRVEELMRLCDALEAKAHLETTQHAQLVATLLSSLTTSTTPQELSTNWQRVATHFDLLLDRPEAVDALEQTILQLAVRGLLVPQDPQDEPASTLLQNIRLEKDRLIADGKIKRDKPLPSIAEDEQPFASPSGWEWVPVGDVVEMLNGYAFKSEWFKKAGTRLLRNVNVAHGHVDWSTPAFIDSALASEFDQFALNEGDVVLTLDRPIISTGLKLAVLQKHDLPCLLLQRVARLSPIPQLLSQEYLVLWMQSDAFVGTLDPGRSNGVPHISTKQVASMAFPLPSPAEQSRIVTRVTQLRQLCAELRSRLSTSQSTQAQLAEALVADLPAHR